MVGIPGCQQRADCHQRCCGDGEDACVQIWLVSAPTVLCKFMTPSQSIHHHCMVTPDAVMVHKK